ncbi:hypothetical protein [Bacillus cereus]|uniref:hypothetical protein n=1 Tax=Bacillus cereus TaxID=1396 RepID=UPI0014443BE5|nr:hypothetical protein [Bacillus cereus]NKW82824.1 hypothetical protein [Bacillus cereus]
MGKIEKTTALLNKVIVFLESIDYKKGEINDLRILTDTLSDFNNEELNEWVKILKQKELGREKRKKFDIEKINGIYFKLKNKQFLNESELEMIAEFELRNKSIRDLLNLKHENIVEIIYNNDKEIKTLNELKLIALYFFNLNLCNRKSRNVIINEMKISIKQHNYFKNIKDKYMNL